MTRPTDDPVLRRFRSALDEIYGDKSGRVVLFGSRAQGDAHDDSDYDVAVFFKSPPINRRNAAGWPIFASGFWTIQGPSSIPIPSPLECTPIRPH
jgi:predicted nucleotidyltransferase